MAASAADANRLAPKPNITIDAFLGGRVEAVQPASGHHRAGLEAVLLAASLPTTAAGTIVELGAGVGVAGFCVGARCPDATIVLVERDSIALRCARDALAREANSAFAHRIDIVETDIETRKGLEQGIADAVIFNPPFHDPAASSASPATSRAGAHVLGDGGLDPWFRASSALAGAGASATVIFRADGLDLVMAAAKGRFGALDILPIAPRTGESAIRILVRGVKGSRAALRILPPVILHEDNSNRFRPEIDAILRNAQPLDSVVPSWSQHR